MNWRAVNWGVVILWAIRLAVIATAVWLGRHWLHGYEEASRALDTNGVISNLLKAFGLGFVVFAFFFFDILQGLGGRMASFIFPEVGNAELRPQYSIAEARAREGNFDAAIVEFGKVLEEFPDDVNAHVRIAEILCQHFRRYDDGVNELRKALAKPSKPDRWAFVANRLADIQVEYMHDFVAARETLQQIILKFPATKYAGSATARVHALNDKEKHEKSPPKPRLKVAESEDGDRV